MPNRLDVSTPTPTARTRLTAMSAPGRSMKRCSVDMASDHRDPRRQPPQLAMQPPELAEGPDDDARAGPALLAGHARQVVAAPLAHGRARGDGAHDELGADHGAAAGQRELLQQVAANELERAVDVADGE